MNTYMADAEGRGSNTPGSMRPKTQWQVKGHTFRVDARYSKIKDLGVGAYGVVCSASDSVTGTPVAIKKVTGLFDDLVDAKRILREVRLLRSMRHENILGIVDLDEPEDYNGFNELYIITPLLEADLGKLLSSKVQLEDSQRKFLVYQMLKAAKYLAVGNILHRDLKPANIVVNSNCDLRIVDFGLARHADPENDEAKTEYVVTRWYRAPELLLQCGSYGHGVDMWSIGLICAELYSRVPILKGRNTKHQLELMFGVVNDPQNTGPEALDWVTNANAKAFLLQLEKRLMGQYVNDTRSGTGMRALRNMCGGDKIDDVAFDFIVKCLSFNPQTRLTPEQALEHPYVAEYRRPDTEVVPIPGSLEPLLLEPPSEKVLGIAGIRRLLWNEILHFHPDAKQREPATATQAKLHVEGVEQQRAAQAAALHQAAAGLNKQE